MRGPLKRWMFPSQTSSTQLFIVYSYAVSNFGFFHTYSLVLIILIHVSSTCTQRNTQFIAMLKMAKYVLYTYVPPKQIKDVEDCLLLENYRDYISLLQQKSSLLMLDYFLALMGDGAAIVKCPMTSFQKMVSIFVWIT